MIPVRAEAERNLKSVAEGSKAGVPEKQDDMKGFL